MKRIASLAILVALSGCASIVSGTTQEIAVNSSPSDAQCDLTRQGARLQQVTTPAMSLIQRTKYDLTVTCSRPGYQSTAMANPSGVEPWVFGNLVFGGLVGVIIDFSTGAQNRYNSNMTVVMPPAAVAMAPAAGARPAT